jgi:hypothetical protein
MWEIDFQQRAAALSAATDAAEGMFGKMQDVLDKAEQAIALKQHLKP